MIEAVILVGVVLIKNEPRGFYRLYNKDQYLNMSHCLYDRRKLQQQWEKYPNIWMCEYEN